MKRAIMRHRLLLKAILSITVTVLLILCVFFVALYTTAEEALKKQLEMSADKNLESMRHNMDELISTMNNSMYVFMQDSVLLSGSREEIAQYFQNFSELNSVFDVKMLLSGDEVLGIDSPMLLNGVHIDTDFYYGKAIKNRIVITQPYYSPLLASRSIALIYAMQQPEGGTVLLVAEIRTRRLFKELKDRLSGSETLVVLTPEGETAFFDYTSPILGPLTADGGMLDIGEALREDLMYRSVGASEMTYQDKKLIVRRMRYTPWWNLYILVNAQEYYSELEAMTRTFWKIGGCALVILILLGAMLGRNITRPVTKLAAEADKLMPGQRTPLLSTSRQDEIGILAQSFNRLLERLQRANDEKAAIEKQHYKMEYKVLQSQIQPHFLFNIHMCIDGLLEQGDAVRAREMLRRLDALLRSSTDKHKEIVPLREELETVWQYVELHKMRLGDSFDLEIHGEEGYEQIAVPKLLIQPVVENAIYHGLAGISYRGRIDIRFEEIDGRLHIFVEDNGNGISQERLQEIRSEDALPSTSQRGMVSIGLSNVRRRIRFFYGEDCGLYIQSRERLGTTVEMTIGMDEYHA